jgi:hypothetical protein
MYVVFLDTHQGIDDLAIFYLLLKAYMNLRKEWKWKHTCITYIVKSTQGSKEKSVILLDQDVYVWNIYDGYPTFTMLLESYLSCLRHEKHFC